MGVEWVGRGLGGVAHAIVSSMAFVCACVLVARLCGCVAAKVILHTRLLARECALPHFLVFHATCFLLPPRIFLSSSESQTPLTHPPTPTLNPDPTPFLSVTPRT